MDRLLAPAILLINQLTYAKKFILVSLLFYIPIGIMSSILISGAYQNIVTADKKVHGAELINELLTLRERAETFVMLQAVSVSIASYRDTDALNEANKKLRNELQALSERNKKYLDKEYPTLTEDIAAAIAKAKKITTSDGEIAPALASIELLIVEINRYINQVLENTGLRSESDPSIRSSLAFMESKLAAVNLASRRLAVFSMYGINMGFLNATTYDFLDKSYVELQRRTEEFPKIYEQSLPGEVKNQMLAKQVEQIAAGLDKYAILVDEKLINASQMPQNSTEILAVVAGEISAQYQMYSMLLDRMQNLLIKQKASAEAYTYQVIFSILGVLLITAYLYIAFYVSIENAISKIMSGAESMAQGDMTFEMHGDSKDEMGALIERFNESSDKVRHLVEQVGQSADAVFELCNKTQGLSSQTNGLISQQLDDTNQVAVAVSEMSQTAQGIADHSQRAEETVQEARQEAQDSAHIVDESLEKISSLCNEIRLTSETIDQLSSDSKNIAQVVDEIKGIAEQTNLLALNAAIEAARAGEQGRGFAVVADEVRSLSQRTHSSTSNIENIIQQFLQRIQEAVDTMGRSLNMANSTVEESKKISVALTSINNRLESVVEMNTLVSHSVKQQAEVSSEVDKSVLRIRDNGEQTSEKSSDTASASVEMAKETVLLKDALNQFKI